MKKDYDVLIIGAGIGGLTVANYLARQGLKTVILEKESRVGGYVGSFQRGSYTFDGGLTSFGSNGIVFPILQELDLSDQVKFQKVKRQIITDDLNVRVDQGFFELRDALMMKYPSEKEGLIAYFQWVEAACLGFLGLFQKKPFIEKWYKTILPILKLSVNNIPFVKLLIGGRDVTNEAIHRRFFHDQNLIDFFNRLGYPQMSAIVTAGMWYSFREDYWYPTGGMQKFSELLADGYKAFGGEIQLQTLVTKVLVENNQVSGVETRAGLKIYADQTISDVDLRSLLLELIGSKYLAPKLVKRLNQGEPSKSMFSLFLGLNGKGFEASPYKITASHSTLQLRNKIGKVEELALNIPSLADPNLSPEGETVILSAFDEYDDWNVHSTRSATYYQQKEKKKEALLSIARRIFPDLDQRLVHVECATPLTFQRYTGNYKGATAGWSWNPRKWPKIHWQNDLSLKNLILTGHWLYHPGGVPLAMLTGRTAGLKLRKKFLN